MPHPQCMFIAAGVGSVAAALVRDGVGKGPMGLGGRADFVYNLLKSPEGPCSRLAQGGVAANASDL